MRPDSALFSTDDAIRLARRRLPRLAFDFIAGATGREHAAAHNAEALRALRLQPRALVPTEGRTLATPLLDDIWERPFGIAPMGLCNLVHPDADALLIDTARRCTLPVCTSTAASTSLEQVAARAGGLAWFQLYVTGGVEDALALVERALQAGYHTLVLTVDVPQASRRIRDQRNGLQLPFRLGARQLVDFALHPRWTWSQWRRGAPSPANFDAAKPFDRGASRGACDRTFLDTLRQRWPGRLLVKGITHPDDARAVREAGADAVWVSNHGGRQLDAAPAAIDILPRIRAALGRDCPILFDSGLQNGEDIVKALACGADFCMLGRPWLYALGAGGGAALDRLVDFISADIDTVMAQLGVTRTVDISEQHLWQSDTNETRP
ncbi:MAG: alpha-hydroxy acid oxidase [Pseudomonadota bacterium]